MHTYQILEKGDFIMKRTLSFLLASTMVLSALASCGGNQAPTPQTPTEVSVVDGKEMLGNMYLEGEKILEEPMTFQFMSFYETRQTAFGDMAFFQEIAQRTNVNIQWELVPTADWSQKKNLKLASGVYPDAFFAGMTNTDVTTYSAQGVLIPLDDLIEKYAPNITALFQQYPEYKASCTAIDGKIYSLSSWIVDPGGYNPDQLFINKTWLDNLGLPVPTTTEEFYEVLTAFKNDDPNGNGIQDEIPFSARYNNYIQGFHSLFGSYGRVDFSGNGSYSHFVVEDDKLVFTANQPEYKTAVTELHRYFAAGLFDQEIFTQDTKQYFAKGKTEEMTLGAFVLWNAGNMVGPEREGDYVPVAPLIGPDGHQIWTRETSGNSASTTFAITNQCTNPEVLIRWLDAYLDPDVAIEAAWGPTQGEAPKSFTQGGEGQSFDDYRYQQAPIWGPSVVPEDYYGTLVETPEMMLSKMEIMEEYYLPYMTNHSLPPLKMTQEEQDWFAGTGADINNLINDNQAKWLLNGGIESEWDTYVAQLEKLGIDQHIAYMQAAYDRYLSS